MRIIEFALVLLVLAAAAGCGQDESENVMATRGNALTEAQIERALGPEVRNEPETSAEGATNDFAEETGALSTNSAEEEQP